MSTEIAVSKKPGEQQVPRPGMPDGSQNTRRQDPGRGGISPWIWVAGLVLAALIILGVWNHVARNRAEKDFEEANSQTVVEVKTVRRDNKTIKLVLPGSVEANQVTTLYARTNGYLGQWLVDIGDNVKQGQRLAVIETPDVEQQLRQAEGALNQAKSNFEIARVTAVRWQQLYLQKVVAAQENDQQQSAYQAAAAALSSAQANVNLLQQQLSFNQIIAPFDGRITNRYLDVGALVAAGSGSVGTAIYGLSQTDPLRVYVYVPQSNAALIHPGATAKLLVREYPGRTFTATVARTAGAIDPLSRTLLTELLIPNRDGVLYAGMYGEIEFALHPNSEAPVIVPDNAFMFRPSGAQVVVVKGDKLHWQTIQVGRDYGTELEALSGLNGGETVVMNPRDDLIEGLQVKAVQQPSPSGAQPAGGSGGSSQSPQPAGSPKG